MKFYRLPKGAQISQVRLDFDSGTDLLDAIEGAIRLARAFSDKCSSCRVLFSYDGVALEVTEFSNADDMLNYFGMRRRMRRFELSPGSRA